MNESTAESTERSTQESHRAVGDAPSPPTVAVIVPARDRAELLRRCLRSLERQTLSSFEVIVIDDGSATPIAEVVQESALREVRTIRQDPSGASVARNAGVAAARAELITFVDSDDEADPEWLETMVGLLRDGGAQVGFCAARRLLAGTQVGYETPSPVGSSPPTLFLAGTFMLERALFERVGGYDTSLPSGQHTDLGYRLMRLFADGSVTSVATTEQLLTIHLQLAGNIRSDPEAVARGALALVHKHHELLRTMPSTLANYYAVAGVNTIRSGGTTHEARRYFRRAVGAEPRNARHWSRFATTLVPGASRRRWLRRDSPPTT